MGNKAEIQIARLGHVAPKKAHGDAPERKIGNTDDAILGLYRATLEDLERGKQRLWVSAQAAVLLLGGLLALSRSLPAGPWTFGTLVGLAAAVGVVGLLVEVDTLRNLDKYRACKNRVITHIGGTFETLLRPERPMEVEGFRLSECLYVLAVGISTVVVIGAMIAANP